MATILPVLTESQSVDAIAEAEAGILQCLQTFLCATLTVIVPLATDTLAVAEEKIDVAKTLICAMAAKEKSIGVVLEGLASKILADKGLVPGGNGNCDICDC